jgi:hypothetical protein
VGPNTIVADLCSFRLRASLFVSGCGSCGEERVDSSGGQTDRIIDDWSASLSITTSAPDADHQPSHLSAGSSSSTMEPAAPPCFVRDHPFAASRRRLTDVMGSGDQGHDVQPHSLTCIPRTGSASRRCSSFAHAATEAQPRSLSNGMRW